MVSGSGDGCSHLDFGVDLISPYKQYAGQAVAPQARTDLVNNGDMDFIQVSCLYLRICEEYV